eukprot:TRINITY_DN4309_c0_g1_i1.p1 TRINITY_DN4309_c0_g1~~TRINITY_DN4309_c0_g1_i1.p1  ORF type:complete len:440 (-),score=73.22 TRINITY_DN4309_c0_g1_i1:121-1440(-)
MLCSRNSLSAAACAGVLLVILAAAFVFQEELKPESLCAAHVDRRILALRESHQRAIGAANAKMAKANKAYAEHLAATTAFYEEVLARMTRTYVESLAAISALQAAIATNSSLAGATAACSEALSAIRTIQGLMKVNVSCPRPPACPVFSAPQTLAPAFSPSERKPPLTDYYIRNNVMAIVHFNSMRYQRIELFGPYVDMFPKIVFCGERDDSKVFPPGYEFFECVDGSMGIAPYYCVAQVMETYPNFTGHMHWHFDAVFGWRAGQTQNLSRLWMAGPDGFSIGDRAKEAEYVAWSTNASLRFWAWGDTVGIPAVNVAWKYLTDADRETYYKWQGGNTTKMIGSIEDYFYVPGRFRTDFIRLSKVFALAPPVETFGEIAVPTIMRMLARHDEDLLFVPEWHTFLGDYMSSNCTLDLVFCHYINYRNPESVNWFTKTWLPR